MDSDMSHEDKISQAADKMIKAGEIRDDEVLMYMDADGNVVTIPSRQQKAHEYLFSREGLLSIFGKIRKEEAL